MTMHISILGIDGSGKSTITDTLPSILAGELNTTIGSAGDVFKIIANDQDIYGPDFCPRALPWQVRVAGWARKIAKRAVNNKKWYPVFKFLHMFFQDAAACQIAQKINPQLFISDGNAVLSSFGRQDNYFSDIEEVNRTETRSILECYSHAFYYLLVGGKLTTAVKKRFPKIEQMRSFSKKASLLGCRGLWLPDLVIFLDISTAQAIRRINARGKPIDRHENLADLEQARQGYLNSLKVFKEYRGGPGSVHSIHVDDLSTDQILRSIVNIIKEHTVSLPIVGQNSLSALGTTALKLDSRSAMIVKVSHLRYVFSYLIGKFTRGAWREPLFLFSRSGRQFLNQGYSASIMKSIYDHDPEKSGIMERVFQNYPLHRAVYDRLQILTKQMEKIIRRKLSEYGEVTIFTAPSGYSYDIFKPLENIADTSPDLMRRIKLFASDLDPKGAIEPELSDRAKQLGISFSFIKGDLTSNTIRKSVQKNGPFDIVLFVGLSSWLPKHPLISHLRWVRQFMEWDSILVTDCFTADAYALSGSYIGYKAHYYSPSLYSRILEYCGFDGEAAVVESGSNGINHVVITCPRYSLERTMLRSTDEVVAIK
jgi:deoxyadenosine/deoxycytidine kinase